MKAHQFKPSVSTAGSHCQFCDLPRLAHPDQILEGELEANLRSDVLALMVKQYQEKPSLSYAQLRTRLDEKFYRESVIMRDYLMNMDANTFNSLATKAFDLRLA